jgi:hypothetical protein
MRPCTFGIPSGGKASNVAYYYNLENTWNLKDHSSLLWNKNIQLYSMLYTKMIVEICKLRG